MAGMLESGDIVAGRYRLGRRLGEGGMGVVWQATQLNLDRVLAIKLLRHELAGDHPMLARFIREAQASAHVEHDNIVRVLDTGDHLGMPFIAMELLTGMSLADLLRGCGRLSPREALAILTPAASAVSAAHKRGIVHRDIKPGNIFLHVYQKQIRTKVLDFGIAKLLVVDAEEFSTTRTGQIMGSPTYMSPEQLSGNSTRVDQRTDIFAFSAVLYEVLSGRPPFIAESFVDLAIQIMQRSAPPLRELRPDVAPELEALVQRALEKEPTDRFATLEQMLDAMAAAGGPSRQTTQFEAFGELRRVMSTPPTGEVSPAVITGTDLSEVRSANAQIARLEQQPMPTQVRSIKLGGNLLAAGRVLDPSASAFFESANQRMAQMRREFEAAHAELSKGFELARRRAATTHWLWLFCVFTMFSVMALGVLMAIRYRLNVTALGVLGMAELMTGFLLKVFQQREDQYREECTSMNRSMSYTRDWLMTIQTIDALQSAKERANHIARLADVLIVRVSLSSSQPGPATPVKAS